MCAASTQSSSNAAYEPVVIELPQPLATSVKAAREAAQLVGLLQQRRPNALTTKLVGSGQATKTSPHDNDMVRPLVAHGRLLEPRPPPASMPLTGPFGRKARRSIAHARAIAGRVAAMVRVWPKKPWMKPS